MCILNCVRHKCQYRVAMPRKLQAKSSGGRNEVSKESAAMRAASGCVADSVARQASCQGGAAIVPSRPHCFAPDLNLTGQRSESTVSSCGDSEGRANDTASPSQLLPADWKQDLYELCGLVTGILLNAQLLEWKLPPYSHLKRPLREVERNARRSSELLKGLISRYSHAHSLQRM
jgi:hypothetical protein